MSVSDTETIVRLAAKGDGVTERGHHVRGSLPGDEVDSSGIVQKGPHHVAPPCSHFGKCGGCELQYADEAVLARFVEERVVNAASGQGLEPVEILPVHLSPPKSRRRATLHALRTAKGAVLGYREAGSHRIVDLSQCDVIDGKLFGVVAPIREFIGKFGPSKSAIDVQLTLCDQGVDAAISGFPLEGLAATEGALDFARDHSLARLSIDQGYGAETVWEPEPVSVTLAGLPVAYPAGSFLQATPDAEAQMIRDAKAWLEGAGLTVDLFSGLGTFAFALRQGRKVLAVEAEQAAHLACKSAAARTGGSVHAIHRDLFRNPLQPSELNNFAAALLDPPRAGAKAQVAEIAASELSRVVYVSCNPSSWARDAATLSAAGFRLEKVRPVGQFRWSTHVELVSYFER